MGEEFLGIVSDCLDGVIGHCDAPSMAFTSRPRRWFVVRISSHSLYATYYETTGLGPVSLQGVPGG